MPADARDVEFIELNGEVGRVYRQTVLKTFKTSEFADLLKRNSGVNTGLLPFGCICLKEGKYERLSTVGQPGTSYRLHVIAVEPRVWTIRFHGVDNGERRELNTGIRTFPVAMPWIYIFVLYQNQGLARVLMFAGLDVDGVETCGGQALMFHVPLPNINNGQFCLGELKLESTQSFYQKTNRVVKYIRESVWNNDLWPILGDPKKPDTTTPNIFGLKHWAEKTTECGQGFWRSLRLRSAGCNINTVIQGLTQ